MNPRPFPATRRDFLRSAAGIAGLLSAGRAPAAGLRSAGRGKRPTIALLGTVVFQHSHAQHFIDRFLMGYAWRPGWRRPEVDLVSLYIDQFPENDLARARATEHGVPLHGSIREALCRGGDRLAVDGVVIIGEHGQYPRNALGQTLYPRHAWFREVVRVFEESGRSVPVFNDKHLSTDWAECVEMVEASRRLGFPFLAGSSLPVTWRLPAVDLPYGAPLKESVCVCYGGVDSYDFHGLETAQCMSERRRGGETGIRSVQALRGAAVWDRVADRPDTRRLLVSALSCSHNLPVENGFPTRPVTWEWARGVFPDPTAYFIGHRDGLQTSMFLLPIRDFNYAGLRSDRDEILSCQMYLPMPGHGSTTADFFNPLIRHIEDMVVRRRAPYPVERTLLTSGMTLAGVRSLAGGQATIDTPEMDVRYRAPRRSQFWGAPN